MEQGAFILAVQGDSDQAAALERALAERVRAQLQIVDSKDTALSIVDLQIPDVILLDPLMPPPDEDYLLTYVRALADAAHVQVIGLPYLHLEASTNHAVTKRSFFRRMRTQASSIPSRENDVRLFAADVSAYIKRARRIRQRAQEESREYASAAANRRGDPRWSGPEIPWLSAVRMAGGENADLINISSGGALVRTHVRPVLVSQRHVDVDFRQQPGLTFHLRSGAEVRVDGRVIRCKVKSETGTMLYEVAFRFDESVGLDLPLPPDGVSTSELDRFALTSAPHHQMDIPWTDFVMR
jgi:CheY-like chemotaxis protein